MWRRSCPPRLPLRHRSWPPIRGLLSCRSNGRVTVEEPLRLVFFEYRDELPGGLTRPLLVAAMDEAGNEKKVVLKVREPDVREGHFRGTSLASELICAVLARGLDIPVPDYA